MSHIVGQCSINFQLIYCLVDDKVIQPPEARYNDELRIVYANPMVRAECQPAKTANIRQQNSESVWSQQITKIVALLSEMLCVLSIKRY